MNVLKAADLFCGAGGTSTGLIEAARSHGYNVELTAINHWSTAIAKGLLSTLAAIILPLWSWYLIVENLIQRWL